MNGPPPRIDHEDAPAARAANAVLDLQQRLAAEFGSPQDDPSSLTDATGPFERMLSEVLTSIGWQGEQRKLLEALPHLEPMLSVTMLRTVLARLDVSLIPIERGCADLSAHDLPCLLVEAEDDCRLLVRRTGGELETYDLRSADRAKADARLLRGTVYLIKFGETESAVSGKSSGEFVGYVLKQLRGPLIRIAAYSAAVNLLGLGLSLYVLLVYDIVIGTSSLDTLEFLALGAFVTLALELRLRHARSRSIAYLAARFDGVIAVRTLASVLSLPLSLTERSPLAAQLARFRQFEIGRDLFAGSLASALFDMPFTLLSVIMLFLIGGVLGFVPVAMSLLIVLVCALTAAVGTVQTSKTGANKLRSDALLFELMDKLRTIRNASAESISLARYAHSLAAYQRSRFDSLQRGSNLQTIANGLVALAGIVTLSVGALRVMDETMSLGQLIAAMIIVWRILVPIQIVSLNLTRFRQTQATVRQINEIVRMGNERSNEAPRVPARRLDGNLYASGVYLSLGTPAEPQLRGVNLAVKAGEMVAITGPSGAGKSTLLKLLLGLYPQYMGTVRIDGLDLRQLDPAEVRAAIGYASQQPAFFYGSVAANFRFACPSATDAQIMEALADVGVSLPNPALPDGLATRISGTEARGISQGLLCRLSIARALVKKPPMLLFDDPGNGLDRAGDAAFMAQLERHRGRSTVLLVTARPSHMRLADRVIEMRGGVVAADGAPDTIVPRILARITAAA
jgi:ATP-binding cassette, subfamily C, bacterial LapB